MKAVTRAIQLQELRNRIDKALSEADRGETAEGDIFMQGLSDDLDASERKLKAE
jgi:hypothetical protein